MPQKKYRLSSMTYDEVSLVPAGDNPTAEVVLMKADPTHKYTDGDSAVGTVTRNDDQKESNMAGENGVIKKSDLPDEVVEYINGLEAVVEEITKADATDIPEGDGSDDDDAYGVGNPDHEVPDNPSGEGDGEEDDVEKALSKADPAVKALIAKMQKTTESRIAKAEKMAAEEREQRLTREFTDIAKTLPMINDNPDDLGGLLKELSKQAPTLAPKVQSLLKAANEQIRTANVFTEIGKRASTSDSSTALGAAAAEIRKAEPTLTAEQAEAKALELNPHLYEESLEG